MRIIGFLIVASLIVGITQMNRHHAQKKPEFRPIMIGDGGGSINRLPAKRIENDALRMMLYPAGASE